MDNRTQKPMPALQNELETKPNNQRALHKRTKHSNRNFKPHKAKSKTRNLPSTQHNFTILLPHMQRKPLLRLLHVRSKTQRP